MDINITNTVNNKYEFKLHCKNAITNIHIKPTSCIDPNIINSVFKKNNKNNRKNNTENRDYSNLKKLPWIPNISPKIKREFKKIGKDSTFTSGKNLQQILCQKNMPKLLPNSQPGVYQLNCLCNGKYIGESKKRVLTRCIEHQQDSISGK